MRYTTLSGPKGGTGSETEMCGTGLGSHAEAQLGNDLPPNSPGRQQNSFFEVVCYLLIFQDG